jgi:hypothetical protein
VKSAFGTRCTPKSTTSRSCSLLGKCRLFGCDFLLAGFRFRVSLTSRLLSRNVKAKIHKPVVLYGCETRSRTLREEHRLRVLENRVLRRIFGRNRDDVMGEWRKLHNEELHNLYLSVIIIGRSSEGECSTNGRGEKSLQGFGGKARRKETTRKTEE